jgi:hypothetical protein
MAQGQLTAYHGAVVVEPNDEAIIDLLRGRDAVATEVKLRDGRACLVFNIAWGYDMGDRMAHVTTNVSPRSDEGVIDFFFTDEIQLIADPATGEVLYAAPHVE